MRSFVLALGGSLLFAGTGPASLSSASTPQVRLEAGDSAPDFVLPGSDGKTHRLSDHRGKRAVVIAWFAKAGSAG
jgi:thioredoxin-dependent peroxiredoxin